MHRAILTVGLGFGDEGKGAAVDFLARVHEADLVIRYCGGSQAGHNVQLPDGRRHTFSQFGAATLGERRPRTYLGPNVIIDPLALVHEAAHLVELGVSAPMALLSVHPRSLVSTPWHRALNQLRELARGRERHGSCGQGIGEARAYWLHHGADAIVAADLRDPDGLRVKLELLRQRALLQMQELLPRVDDESVRSFDLWDWNTEAIARRLMAAWPAEVTVSAAVPECRTAIFEGAQGVLLDEYRGFHPHTTWSTVTAHHAWELVAQARAAEVAVLGITRTYTTRHGEGPLPTYSARLTERLHDPGNPDNPWQGRLRCGWLDLPLLRYAIAAVGPLDGVVVSHLDQVTDGEWWVCESHDGAPLQPATVPDLAAQARLTERLSRVQPRLVPMTAGEILARVDELAPVVATGTGPTHRDREYCGIRFRRRAQD